MAKRKPKIKGTVLASDHTEKIFDYKALKKLVAKTLPMVRRLKKSLRFNTLAVCGHSGIVLGAIVAYRLNLPILVVRKKRDDRSADGYMINGTILDNCRYLILDDLISSGDTVRHIISKIYREYENAKPVGVLLYHKKHYRPFQYDGGDLPVKFVGKKQK